MFKRSIPALLVIAFSVAFASPALAEEARPGWGVNAVTRPSDLRPGGLGVILIRPINNGASGSSGLVTVTDVLPPGVTATVAGASNGLVNPGREGEAEPNIGAAWSCSGNQPGGEVAGASVVRCVNNPASLGSIPGGGGTNATTQIEIGVRAPATEGTLSRPNEVTIAGGEALGPASASDPVVVSKETAPFGIAADAWFTNENGTPDTQAGSHPYEATFVVDYNTRTGRFIGIAADAGGEPRDLTVNLPPGIIGSPYALPRCTKVQFNQNRCPPASQVGILTAEVLGSLVFGFEGFVENVTPVFNLVPPAGEPAELGFSIGAIPTYIGTLLRSGSNYSLKSVINNIPQRAVTSSVLTLWGEPGNPSHSQWRLQGQGTNIPEKPFLTLPTSCEGPLEFSESVNSWEHPGEFVGTSFPTHDQSGNPVGFTGCESLGFSQTLFAEPDTSNADTPGGVTAGLESKVGAIEEPNELAATDIKHATFKLPAGFAINPGQGAGLEACSFAQSAIGEEGTLEDPSLGEPRCPNASKVGTDEAELPVLAHPLRGNIYVLPSEPPHVLLLFALAGEGVSAKLVARVEMNEANGQLTANFGEPITAQEEAEDPTLKELKGHLLLPQAPVSNFRASFGGGPQAAVSGPTQCGVYAAEGEAVPWASPFVPANFPASVIAIEHGVNGGPCPPTPLSYTPEMIAGSTTDQAGGYTDFSLLLKVPDDQQRTSSLQFKVPEGLAGMIARIPLCHEQQANEGTCPAASQIGHTTVQSGPGQYPLVVPQPGQPQAPIYLTEGYKGAPFGLSVVVPIHVGPFTLPTQVVRAKVEINPITTEITITTDPLPQYVAGIPTDLRTIDTVIDHPEFMFNPTGCEPREFAGTAYGEEGAAAPISSHFQMGSCQSLKFAPNFKVSTSGKTSKTDGASLSVKVLYPTGNLGANQASSQSNLQTVKVELPERLPSRLTTLQKACTAAQFNSNPAGCPAASVVGHATAVTPVLPVPLTGPAYFVSNGGEAFPNLIVVLQGYGVTVHLVGDTFITKAGVTSSTFKEIPDVPISSFELTLPEGPFSALAANGNLCISKLVMPTEFIGQNGAEIKQNTPISVTGCSTALSIVSHSIKKKTLTLSVYVPAAGKVKASGKGLSSSTKTAKGLETLTFKLTQKKAGKLKTKIKLTFTPSKGKKQTKSIAISFKK
jgi:hypothetical protein